MNAVVQQQNERPPAIIGEATPMALIQRAMEAGNLDLVERFMQMQERWEANQARKAFDAALAAAKAEIKPIVKNREVDFPSKNGGARTNYMHEDLGQIANEVDPVLAKHGLSYRHRPKQDGKNLTITCVLAHRDGHFEETSLTASNDESGNKNSIQSVGSTATYLQRYTLKLALGLAVTKDDDGKAAGKAPEPTITEQQAADLEALCTEVGARPDKFRELFCKVESFDQIPAKNYEFCVAELQRYGREKQAKPK
jgi:hypothetical protein